MVTFSILATLIDSLTELLVNLLLEVRRKLTGSVAMLLLSCAILCSLDRELARSISTSL